MGNSSAKDLEKQKMINQKESLKLKGARYFLHTLKTETVHHKVFETRNEAITKIFEWIEIFYNRQRIHSTLNYQSPVDYEAAKCQ